MCAESLQMPDLQSSSHASLSLSLVVKVIKDLTEAFRLLFIQDVKIGQECPSHFRDSL